jgi:hypothetical protein
VIVWMEGKATITVHRKVTNGFSEEVMLGSIHEHSRDSRHVTLENR